MTATVTARKRVRLCVLKRGLDNLRTSTQSFTARPAPLGENNAPGAGPPTTTQAAQDVERAFPAQRYQEAIFPVEHRGAPCHSPRSGLHSGRGDARGLEARPMDVTGNP